MDAMTLEAVPDLGQPKLYQPSFPHEAFTTLRREDPVHWNEAADDRGAFWAITKYDDIVAISRKPLVFSSASENGGHRLFDENIVGLSGGGQESAGVPFISLDPPSHQRYRTLVTPGLSPSRLREMEGRILERAKAMLGDIDLNKPVEIVGQFSAPVPLLTLAELLDLPASLWPKLRQWTDSLVLEDDEEARSLDIIREFNAFAEQLYVDRRANPGSDVASMVANSTVNGEEMSMGDFVATMTLVLVGGNETTRNSINHGLIAFADNPEQWQMLRANRDLMQTAVREIVRWASPVSHMRRTAMEDVELRGKHIRAGDRVLLWYPSGNRDEEKYENPFDFNIRREGPQHLGFGTGQHVCIGSRLAEMQLRIVFGLLADHVHEFHVTRPPTRVKSNFINGLKELHVEMRPS